MEIRGAGRLMFVILVLCLLGTFLKGTALAGGFIDIPGFDFIVDRAKNHGYAGQAWDIKGRPVQTAILTMNNKGPVFVGLGAGWDALTDTPYALGGLQFDSLSLWRAARKWPLIEKMELIKFPEDWRLLIGPMFNAFRVRPDEYRIDRDIIYNLSIHIPLGRSPSDD